MRDHTTLPNGEDLPPRAPISPPTPSGRGDGGEASAERPRYQRTRKMTLRARNLRRDATDAEQRLWSRLRGNRLGVRFRRQLVFERRYVLDFYAPSVKLAVEADGGQHGVAISKDEARTGFLVKRGVTVLRFWNNEVLGNTDGVMMAVQAVIARLAPRASPPTPLPEGVGGANGDAALEGLNVVFGEIDR